MGFGHRPNSHGEGWPSAKYPWPSAFSVESSTVSVAPKGEHLQCDVDAPEGELRELKFHLTSDNEYKL